MPRLQFHPTFMLGDEGGNVLITLLLVFGALAVFAIGYGAGYFNGVLGLRPDER